ncbi:MAG: DNA primase small subunit domain-containing protein [Candidatus Woesearchaeota archaeon]
MLTLSQTLSYYKRKDVQKLILKYSQDKEIAVRYGERLGKRPDVLRYENDILEAAKQGATSFHCSEELWIDPLQISTEMKKNEIENLRKGWDLILDIDCPYWAFSKLSAYVFIKALKDHGINAVTVKFSGSKGFHIAVPFEAFPKKQYYIDGRYVDVKDMFPEGPRRIAEYLVDYANKNLIFIDEKNIIFGKVSVPINKLETDTGTKKEDMIILKCNKCNSTIKNISSNKVQYICPYCEYSLEETEKPFMKCPKCNRIMEKYPIKKGICKCGSDSIRKEFDLSKIVAVDTILISSRHLYRMPYSLHEKTGLVSLPFDIKKILKFEKSDAEISKFKPHPFLDRDSCISGEAEMLFQKAFDFQSEKYKKDYLKEIYKNDKREKYADLNAKAIPEEYFPPCIKKISLGLEDGKKRALLILINFLSSCNWSYEQIEDYVLKWNERNSPEKLRDTYIKGQLRYHKTQKEKLPPPNCDNRGYMIDTQFCNPDEFCKKIKNPAQYASRKVWINRNIKGNKKRSAKK